MKRIITCSDGTWNKPNTRVDGKPVRTNVQRIFDFITTSDANGITQVKYYDQGIGSEGNALSRMFSGSTGKGIDENILDAYKFICWNYTPGDEIYLFGFSRGAYTARSLGGLIRKSGILKVNDLDFIAEAYNLYRNKNIAPTDADAVQFRNQNSHENIRIKFIGVWDTVGSLGIPLWSFQWYNKKKYTFYDTTISSIIDHAYHALATDEKRGNFKPALWTVSNKVASGAVQQVLEQRWFPGVHSNVGGGYPDTGLSDIALKWMAEKAAATGLAFVNDWQSKLNPDHKAMLYNSAKGLFSILPKYLRPVDSAVTQIDESVRNRMKDVDGYKPENISNPL